MSARNLDFSFDSERPSDHFVVSDTGYGCKNCNHPGHEHDKVQVSHEGGRRRFGYRCPE